MSMRNKSYICWLSEFYMIGHLLNMFLLYLALNIVITCPESRYDVITEET